MDISTISIICKPVPTPSLWNSSRLHPRYISFALYYADSFTVRRLAYRLSYINKIFALLRANVRSEVANMGTKIHRSKKRFLRFFFILPTFFLFLKTFIENTIWNHFRNNGNKLGLCEFFFVPMLEFPYRHWQALLLTYRIGFPSTYTSRHAWESSSSICLMPTVLMPSQTKWRNGT